MHLYKLSALNMDKFIRKLIEHASTKLTSIVGALNGAVPEYLLDSEPYIGDRVLAYASGKYNNNTDPITISAAKNMIIKNEAQARGITETEAEERIFPRKEKKSRATLKANYYSQCEAIMAYSELKMSEEVKNAMTGDPNYEAAKQSKCIISWITRMRIRGSTGSSNPQEQMIDLKDQLDKLKMGNHVDDYYAYKIRFTKLVEALKLLTPAESWEESTKITLFLSHLDNDIFHNVLVERLRNTNNEFRALKTLSETYKLIDGYHESIKVARSITERPESIQKAYVATASGKRQKTNHSSSPEPQPTFGICKFYKPSKRDSCSRGAVCRFRHLDSQASIDKAKELMEQLKEITSPSKH